VSKKDPFRADKTESLDKEFSKKVSRINKKNMENVKGNLNKLKGSKESLEDNEDIFKKKAKKYEYGGSVNKFGGPVKMGATGGVCKGMGAARAGGKFKIR